LVLRVHSPRAGFDAGIIESRQDVLTAQQSPRKRPNPEAPVGIA
jgi:hypothetical protein